MIKKFATLLLLVTFVTTIISGCSKESSTKVEDQGAKTAVELTLMFWDDFENSTDLMTLEYKKRIDEFNAADNGYQLKTITTSLADYDAKLNAMISSKTMPDMIFCNPGPSMNQYVQADVLMPMSDTLTKDKAWSDTFLDGIFDRISYDGKAMAIPVNFAAACVFYNTEIFDEVGVKVPTNWTEFLDVCDKIKAAGYSPITASGVDAWCIAIPAAYFCDREGGPDNIQNIIAGTGTWNDPSYISAGNKLVELVDKGYFQDTLLGDGNDQATANFYNGKAAMLIQGSWAIGQINGADSTVGEKTGVFTFPSLGSGDPNRWIVKTDNICVSKDTKNLEGCVEFLKLLTSQAGQKATAEVAGKIPVIKNVDIDYAIAPKQFSSLNDCLANMTGSLGFYNEMLPTAKLGDEFNNTIVSIITKQKTPEQAFGDLQKFFDNNK